MLLQYLQRPQESFFKSNEPLFQEKEEVIKDMKFC